MNYETPVAFRMALERRLLDQSRAENVDLARLRRRAVLERMLVRLERSAPSQWVLKGGMALEVRWHNLARATRDLDLAYRTDSTSGDEIRLALAEDLQPDPDGDWFQFSVGQPSSIAPDEAGRPAWRMSVEARLAGKNFATVPVDVVFRPEEITRTERIMLPGVLGFAGIDRSDVEAIDRNQHFAEKLHALTRSYADRPNSRVKDLADLLLLIEDGLNPSTELLAAVEQVFESRSTHSVPNALPDPPSNWGATYSDLSSKLDIGAKTVIEAMSVLRTFWARVLTERKESSSG